MLSCLRFFSTAQKQKIPVWCAQGVEAFRKCEEITDRYRGRVKCIMGEGEVDCYQKIAAGLADFSAFDGGSIFDAGLFLIIL